MRMMIVHAQIPQGLTELTRTMVSALCSFNYTNTKLTLFEQGLEISTFYNLRRHFLLYKT